MSHTTTLPERPQAPAAPVSIVIDDDATPIVRLIGRTLGDAARADHAPDVLGQPFGVVAVRSHDTPQCATVAFDNGRVTVTGGVFVEPDATVVVDLEQRFAARAEPIGDQELAAGLQRALLPPLPHWRDAAARFWALASGIPGIPDVLSVTAVGVDGTEEAQFGTGPQRYRMAGAPDALAAVFSGTDYLLTALAAGLAVQGTLSQLSVLTAASWKVRFDV